VTVTEAKINLRIATSSDDAEAYAYEDEVITRIVKAAREYCEHYTDRAFISQVWETYLDDWPADGIIKLPKSPLITVDSIAYTDSDGTVTAFTSYYVDSISEIGRIVLNDSASWPSAVLREVNPIKITYTVGYSTVPAAVKTAMHLIIGTMYNNRESVVTGVSVNTLPLGVNSMLDTLRLYDGV